MDDEDRHHFLSTPMKLAIHLLLLLVSTCVYAQNLVHDRLNSKKVERRVVVNFTGDFLTPRYSIDDKDYRITDYGWYNQFNERTTFAIADKTASLQLRFLNPLRYRVKISTRAIDDPLAQTDTLIRSVRELAGLLTPAADFTKFFTGAVGNNVSKATAKSEIKAVVPAISDANANIKADAIAAEVQRASGSESHRINTLVGNTIVNAALSGAVLAAQKDNIITAVVKADEELKEAVKKIKSSSLLEWMMWVQQGSACFAPDKQLELIKKVAEIEMYLYSPDFEKSIKDKFVAIQKQDIITDYKAEIKDTRDQISLLRKEIDDTKTAVKVLDDAGYYTPGCSPPVDVYSQARMSGYVKYATRILDKRLSVLTGLSELCDELEKYVQDADEERNTVLVESLTTTEKKINEVTLSVQRVEWEQYNGTISWKFKIRSTKELSKVTFNVVPYTTVLTEFGVGVLYFLEPLDFPKYERADNAADKSKVVQTTSNFVRYLPMPTVTFLPCWGKGDVFWQFQVGVSLANSQPVFHVGGGLRLFSFSNSAVKSMSIMSGVAFRFVKAPNTLLDKEATKEELEKDLTTQLKGPAFPYLGFQFNF